MTTMRLFLILTVCTLIARADAQAISTTPARAPFSIAISTPNDAVRAGADVTVNIVLTNTSDHEVNLEITMAPEASEVDFAVDVRDETGKAGTHTKWGHQLKGNGTTPPAPMRSSSFEVSLKPGESMRPRINVSRVYDMTQPGKYAIRVSRFDPASLTSATSNNLTITVTP